MAKRTLSSPVAVRDNLDSERRHLRTVGWLLIALIFQVGASRWHDPTVISVDYFTLWAVPAALASLPNRDIYSYENQLIMANTARVRSATGSPAQKRAMSFSDRFYQGRIDATGSPLAYTLVGLTSSGDYDGDLGRFGVVSFVAFLVSIWLICRLLGFSLIGTAIAAGVYGLCFSPLLADLRSVNVNQLQLFALSLSLWLHHKMKRVLAGIVLGFAVAFKPNLAAVLVVGGLADVTGGRLREALPFWGGVGAGGALGIVAGATYFGTMEIWRLFWSSILRTLQLSYPLEQGNYSLASVIAKVFGIEVPLAPAVVAILAVLLVLMTSRPRADRPPVSALDEQFLVFGIGCAVMVLSSSLAWKHYYTLLIPLSLYLLHPTSDTSKSRVGQIGSGIALLLLSPAAEIKASELFIAVTVNIAAVILFGAGLYTWWTIRRTSRA